MSAPGGERKAAAAHGLLNSLAQLARTLVATLRSRAELFALEIARERGRVVRLVLLAVASLFFLVLAAFTATVFVIVVFWDGYRIAAAGALFLIYLGIGLYLGSMARKAATKAAQPFQSTLEQLRKDRDVLL